MQYCLAAEILDHRVGLDTFSDDLVMRPEAQAMIPKVEMRRIPGYEGRPSWVEAYNEVTVYMQDGRVLTQRADRVTQGALRGVTMDEIRAKFMDCSSLALATRDWGDLMVLIYKL